MANSVHILTIIIFFLWHVCAFYEDVDFIYNIDDKSFPELVIRSPSVWVVEFYAPWCPHCRNFQSDYTLAAENLKGLVNFGAVDCDVEGNKPLCGFLKIESLPTIAVFRPILEPIEMEGQKGYSKNPVKYQGPLKPATIAKWAASFLSDPIDPVVDVTLKNIDSFVNDKKVKFKALVFSDKDKKSNLIRSIALKFHIDILTSRWITIGQVSHKEKEIVEKYDITSFPNLIIINEKGEKVDSFTGSFNPQEISDFLFKHAHVPTEKDIQGGAEPNTKQKSPSPPPKKKKESILHHVTNQESFDSVCFRLGLCIITFLDPEAEEHQSYIETLNELVKKYPSVQFMWLDGTKHNNFKNAFGVAESYPQAVAFQRKALRYRIFMGGFDSEILSEFIEMVQSGSSKKGRITILDKEPMVEDEFKDEL